jgi:hypothetical protein
MEHGRYLRRIWRARERSEVREELLEDSRPDVRFRAALHLHTRIAHVNWLNECLLSIRFSNFSLPLAEQPLFRRCGFVNVFAVIGYGNVIEVDRQLL